MLGRKTFTRDEIDAGRTAATAQLAALTAQTSITPEAEAELATAIVMALDRRYVHRVRGVSGKDGNPLNEVELIVEAFLDHGGAFTTNNVIKHVPERTVLQLADGDRIHLNAADVTALADAFFAELETRFAEA
jgi:hypothetical protein